jgi:hypothetical protein
VSSSVDDSEAVDFILELGEKVGLVFSESGFLGSKKGNGSWFPLPEGHMYCHGAMTVVLNIAAPPWRTCPPDGIWKTSTQKML